MEITEDMINDDYFDLMEDLPPSNSIIETLLFSSGIFPRRTFTVFRGTVVDSTTIAIILSLEGATRVEVADGVTTYDGAATPNEDGVVEVYRGEATNINIYWKHLTPMTSEKFAEDGNPVPRKLFSGKRTRKSRKSRKSKRKK